ncbi:MAG: cytochrome b/b6 domain-containing protein, partial [Xanthobacteraceae bacterium]
MLPAYTPTARVLHWITAALVLTMVPLGFVIANEWGGSQQERLYDLHKSVGALLIPVVIIRLIYRLFESPQPLPADIPAIQQFAAHAMHWVLYTLLIVQPLVGWIGTSAY